MLNIEKFFSNYYKGSKEPSLEAMKYFMDKFDNNDINKYVSGEELYNIALEYKSNHKILKMCLDEAIKFVIDKHKNNSIFFIGSFYTYGHILETISKYKYI